MAIDIKKQGISYLVGGAVVALEYWDQKATTPRTKPFRTAADIGVVVGNLGGMALQQFMPKYAALGETIAVATGPLLVKAIVRAVKPEWTWAAQGSQTSGGYVQRRMATRTSGRVSDNVTLPEFEGARSY